MKVRVIAVAIVVLVASIQKGHTQSATQEKPFTVEYYYRVKLGHFDEWVDLYRQYHWPVMTAEMKDGYILAIKLDQPENYWPEPYRWDLRITITYRNVLVPHGLLETNRKATVARLFPDRDLFDREEQHRFELLDGFWSVELDPLDTSEWKSGAPN